MSGGAFDYKQHAINDIANDVEDIILKNGKKKSKDDLYSWQDDEFLKKYPETEYHSLYSDDVIREFKNGLLFLRLAAIYAHRIDWLVSCDDGEESFIDRLTNELMELHDKLNKELNE